MSRQYNGTIVIAKAYYLFELLSSTIGQIESVLQSG